MDQETTRRDELLDDYVRQNVVTYCHALGTARMGPRGNVDSVVDQQFRVSGVKNLRVVDASVIPSPPRVVPNLTVIMLAERAAVWMRELGGDSQ